MSLVPERMPTKIGTGSNPVDDVTFINANGQPQSLRELELAAGGSNDQPFTVLPSGDVMMDPDKVTVNAPGYVQDPDYPYYMVKPYVGLDLPGNGDNTLSNLQSRIWRTGETGQVYLVSRISNEYWGVELTRFI